MRKSRLSLSQHKQNKLIELFVAAAIARTATELVNININKTTVLIISINYDYLSIKKSTYGNV